jgi:predicted membrane channel-forming protein YqfA (hemolysin III family)
MTQKDPLADIAWPGASVAPSAGCSESIRGTCTKGLCKQRGVSATVRAALTVGLSALLLLYYGWYALAEHPRGSGVVHTAAFGALGWLGAQGVMVFLALARPPGKRGSRALRVALLVALPVLFVAYLAFISTEQFDLAKFSEASFAGHAAGCGAVALLFGALIAGGALVAWRHTDPYNPGLSGAIIGMVAGLASGSGMSIACGSHELWHSFVAHGAIVFVLSLAGFGLGRRLLAP